jgi:hypothetical protein
MLDECLIIPEYVRNNQKKNKLIPKKESKKTTVCDVVMYSNPVPLKRRKVKKKAKSNTTKSIDMIIQRGKYPILCKFALRFPLKKISERYWLTFLLVLLLNGKEFKYYFQRWKKSSNIRNNYF